MQNLDYLSMKFGQKIPENKKSETLITKTLGVLQENGPYAMFLFLEDKKESVADKCYNSLIDLLNEDEIKGFFGLAPPKGKSLEEISKWLIDVSKEIDKLFLLKRILEQTLTYARYYSKALPEKEDKK